MNKFLGIGLIIVALIIGTGIGYVLTPQYSSSSMSSSNMNINLGKADKEIDLRFIDAMSAHHISAIEMAKIAQKESKRPEIIDLATNIISAQSKEVNQIKQWKKDWYNNKDSSFKMDDMMVNLGIYDDKFDLRFINAMIAHHNEAINMAKEIQTKSTRNEVLNLSNNIIMDQSKEIKQMQQWRMAWYQIEPFEMSMK